MSYQGRVHDALLDVLEEHFPEADWRQRSKANEAIVSVVLPIFEKAVSDRAVRQVGEGFANLLIAVAEHPELGQQIVEAQAKIDTAIASRLEAFDARERQLEEAVAETTERIRKLLEERPK